jgi:hypothetical protein
MLTKLVRYPRNAKGHTSAAYAVDKVSEISALTTAHYLRKIPQGIPQTNSPAKSIGREVEKTGMKMAPHIPTIAQQ